MEPTPPAPYDPIRWKAGVLILLFSVLFSLILGRLFWVQVMEGARYRELAKRQYESKVELRAQRGSLYDRHGRDIASMMTMTSYAADPVMLQKPELVANSLAMAAGDSVGYYLAKIKRHKGRFVWLARGVNAILYPDLDTLRDPGLIRVDEPKRSFLYGNTAAQVIGVTDVDNNGVTGIELAYNRQLRGESGFVVMQRDGRGRLRPGVNPERKAPRNGNGLKLTIDIELQRIAEEELRRGVTTTGASSGTVIAIKPSTGEILAMASMPTFDPMRLDRATSDAIRTRGITDQYEPGSTVKAITAAALLEEGLLHPGDQVDGLGGVLQLQDHVIKDDHPLGKTTFQIALEQSSNVVFATQARRLDSRRFYKYFRDFGFGIPSGIDLPGEVRGVLKRPDEFDATTQYFMAFGYELTATAVQMLNAYATIANGGVMMEPHVVSQILYPTGEVLRTIKPQIIRRVIADTTATRLTNMLIGVVEQGTGQLARIPGVLIAGKTGTAQQLVDGSYSRKSYTASFVGYYPADNPQVCMIVMLDRPQSTIYGGSAAAPIFRRIVQKTMTMLDLDDRTKKLIAASSVADSLVIPDVRGLRVGLADSILQRLGLRIRSASDTGLIVQQQPLPGKRLPRGSTVAVKIAATTGTYQPDVRGLTLRRAVTILQNAGYSVKVQGSGHVQGVQYSGKSCIVTAQ